MAVSRFAAAQLCRRGPSSHVSSSFPGPEQTPSLKRSFWSPLFLQASGWALSQQHSAQHRGVFSPRARSRWHRPPALAAPLLQPLPGCVDAQQTQGAACRPASSRFTRSWVLPALALLLAPCRDLGGRLSPLVVGARGGAGGTVSPHTRGQTWQSDAGTPDPTALPDSPGSEAPSLDGPGVILSMCVSTGHRRQTRRPRARMETPPVQQR